jgi:AraC-like DNA-binding protein
VRRDTCRTDVVRRIVDTAERSGIERRDLLRASRLDSSALRDPNGRIALPHLEALWDRGSRWRADLPIRVAGSLNMDDLGPFAFVLKTAPTALDAIRLAVRFYPLINDGGAWELRVDAREVECVWHHLTGARRGVVESNESVLAHVLRGSAEILGEPLAVERVRFTHSARRGARDLESHFGCRVEHDADRTGFVVSRAELERRPTMSNAGMHAFFLDVVERELAPLRERPSTARVVRREVARRLAEGPPAGRAIAASLAITERTLRRRLEAEGTSLRAVVEEVRREELESLVRDRSRSMTRIAHDLGFADSSAFARACRRWFGRSPSALRASS